jgi:hypothetical protein
MDPALQLAAPRETREVRGIDRSHFEDVFRADPHAFIFALALGVVDDRTEREVGV